MTLKSKKIEFPSATGETLVGKLDLPKGKPLAYAIWAHCFSCTKDILAASRVANGLTRRGIAVFRFDFTGLGASGGDFANTNFSSNVEDLVAAADFLREHYEAPKILIGHSWGGTAVLACAHQIPEAKAVCTVAAPADPAHVSHLFQDSLADIEAKGFAQVCLAGRPFQIKKQFLDDIADRALLKKVATLGKALLIFHSPTDALVGIENAGVIYEAAKHPKSFVSLENADHLLTRKEDAEYVANMISAWAARYIDSDQPHDDVVAKAGTVMVAETGQGRFANPVSIGGRHLLRADEPASVGGDDTGPSPYELLLAALGACKVMTMRMYAERKGLALERAQVTLRHSKVPAPAPSTGKVDRIDVDIEVRGDLDAEGRRRIAEIAEKCPVHRTLLSELVIETHYETVED
ncbi:MAG: alpha/beta fold hydrolase [Kofleriaceae bacterium]|nr:alpha/beta fold hydrolase [Kofleriaceae bacterium]